MIIENWGGGKEPSKRGEWNLQRWNESGRDENLKMERIDLKGSRMARRWLKDKGCYRRWDKVEEDCHGNFSEPPCSSHLLRVLFSVLRQIEQTFQPRYSILPLPPLYLCSFHYTLPVMQFFGFTCHISIHAVVDRETHIGVLIKIMTEDLVSVPRKRLSDKDS